MSRVRQALLLMAAFAVLWMAVERVGGALSRPYSPFQVVFVRYAVHLAVLLAAVGWRGPAPWRTARPAYQLGRALLMVAMPACFVAGLRAGVPLPSALALFAASPLLILALARALLGERARWPLWAAAALTALASAAAVRPAGLPRPWLAALPLGMAAAFSLYVVMTRSLRAEGARVNLFYTAAGVAAALLPLQPRAWVTPGPRDALLMAAIGVLGLLALWAVDRLAELAPVSLTAPAASLFPALDGLGRALSHRALGSLAVLCSVTLVVLVAAAPAARAPGFLVENAP